MQSRKFLYFIRLMLASILFSMLPTAQAIPAVAATPMHSNAAVRPRLSTPSPTFTQPTYQQQATPPDFPASTVLDSFDRADGAPGQNWAGVSTGYHIQNNALVAQSGGALYWATSFTSQQEVWTTITNPDAGANEIDLLLKGQGTGGCDVIELLYSPSNHTIQVWTCANESWEQQGATLNATLQAGDRLGARFVDGSIEVYQNSTLIGTIAIPNSWPFANQGGHIGLWIDNPNGLILDDFGGGSLSTTPPPSTGTLQVTGTPASGSITVSAEGRFTLVFDQDHKWQAGAWYDLQSDPSLNLARSDGPTLNYNVIQSPLELYYQGWNNLETATNPTIEIVSQNTEQVVLQTGWQWQTADGSSFMVAATHTINRNGQWQIQSSLTNTSSSSRSIQDRGIEYAFTNVRPQQEWLASTASDQSSFDLTRSDGPTPHPHFVAHRGDTGGLLNTVSTDGDLNRYWTLGNIILESGASWQTSWSNEIWRNITGLDGVALVQPILECVQAHDDGHYTAAFSYENPNNSTAFLAIGTANWFHSAPLDRGQPNSFVPGRAASYPHAPLMVDFGGEPLTWELNGILVTASADSPPCPTILSVDAGPDQFITTLTTILAGQSIPPSMSTHPITPTWSVVSGPGTVTFSNEHNLNSSVTLSTAGSYVLQLTVEDGLLSVHDQLTILSGSSPDLALTQVDSSAISYDGQTLHTTGSVSARMSNVGSVDVPITIHVAFFEDRNGNAQFDILEDTILASSSQSGLVAGASITVTAQLSTTVVFSGNQVFAMVDPDAVITETNEQNNTASTSSTCVYQPVTQAFSPMIEFQWPQATTPFSSSNQVMMTPVVADLDGDHVPEILFLSYTGTSGTAHAGAGFLRAISGIDGHDIFAARSVVNAGDAELRGDTQIAVGDLNLDGYPEIIAADSANHIVIFNHMGQLQSRSALTINGGIGNGGIALANIDQVGPPEIIVGATVFNSDLTRRWVGSGTTGNNHSGPLSIVADIDLDGNPEIIAGRTVYRANGSILWQNTSVGDGFNAVANFDSDSAAEIVLISHRNLYLFDTNGSKLWGPILSPGGGDGGAPTIADMDGDGELEIGIAGSTKYVIFNADGSIRGQFATADTSSNSTGSSVFDFDGDGVVEVVYGDEQKLYIYDVQHGSMRWSTPSPSGTLYELPVIADVDGDGNAEIVKVSNNYANLVGHTGIRVYGDSNDAWVATRMIWNQHSYHITNINDNLSVPAVESPNWQSFNNYRLNTFLKGCASARPDLTASHVRLTRGITNHSLTVRIGNGGALFVPAGVHVAWYSAAPSQGGELLGISTTTITLQPGQYEDITLSVPTSTTALPLWVVVDDNGQGQGSITEGSEVNNAYNSHVFLTTPVNQPPIVDAGADQTTAAGISHLTLQGSVNDDQLPLNQLNSLWSMQSGPGTITFGTATQLSTTANASLPGRYILQLETSDGEYQRTDSVVITVTAALIPPPATVPDLGTLVVPGWIGGPNNQASLSEGVPITLTVGVTLTNGTLSYWPAENPQAITTLATNLSATGGSTLATFDPTLLANGSYVIQLEGTNSLGETKASGIMVTVAGDYKPGRVRFSVTDLTIPLVGMPITIGRTYDSLERNQSSDFGYGWSLDISNPRLTVDPAHHVTITQPNGQRVTFYFAPRSYGGVFGALQQPAYLPEPGVYGSLTANGCAIVVQSGGWHCFLDTPTYAPTTYTYTDPYGRVFVMGADGKLQSITDLNQNRLTFTPQGITSSAGGMHVSFQRDAQGRMTSISDPAGNPYGYGYDAAGDLRSVTLPGVTTPLGYSYETQWPHLIHAIQDARGYQAASASYSPDGRLQTERDADNNTTHYAYDLVHRVTTTTNPDGGTLLMAYTPDGLVLSKTGTAVSAMTYTYDANKHILTETDALGQVTRYSYDSKGHRTSRTDPLGRVTRTVNNQYGAMTSFIDPAGRTTTISSNAQFLPTDISDSYGLLGSHIWDSHGSLLTRTDAVGQVTRSTYDRYGHQLTETDPLSQTTTMSYDLFGRRLSTTDALGHVTRSTYDALGHMLTQENALGERTTYEYDANGNQTAHIDPLGRRTGYQYDAANRQIGVTYPDGTMETTTYDFRGNPRSQTDRAGHRTEYQYDLQGQQTAHIQAVGTAEQRTFQTTYDSLGRRIQERDARGHQTSYHYDAAGQLLQMTDPLSRTTTFTYDVLGQRVTMVDALNRTTQYQYDGRGHPTVTIYPDGSRTTQIYDARGQLVRRVDERGHSTTYAYDGRSQLLTVTNPLSQTTAYQYDAVGNMTQVTDAHGHQTQFAYDALNRPTQTTWPDGHLETNTYNQVGDRTQQQAADGTLSTFQYDVMHRLTLAQYADGQSVQYTYTPTDARASVIDARGTTHYQYDALDRLRSIAQPNGQTLTYAYDAVGNRVAMATPAGTTTYAYDAANQLTQVTDAQQGSTSFTYDGLGNRIQRSLPNGITTSYGYDLRSRLTSITHTAASQTLASFSYTLDAVGNRRSVTEQDGSSTSWDYDAANRLIREQWQPAGLGSAVDTHYRYDAVGNRLTQVRNGLTTTSTYNTLDQLVSSSSTTYQYDGRGNLTQVTDGSQQTQYQYDARNRMTSVQLPGGVGLAYGYDADGRRVSTSMAGVTTTALWDEASPYGDIVTETDATGALLAAYTLAGTELISQRRGGSTQYTLQDAQGSVRALTNSAGSITDRYAYDAFGTTQSHSGSSANPYQYTGQYQDATTGLYQLRARYYQPGDGRFLSRDRMGLDQYDPAEWNRYSYARNNPVLYGDPLGLEAAAPPMPQQRQQGQGGIEYASLLSTIASIGLRAGTVAAVGLATACIYSWHVSFWSAYYKDAPRLLWLLSMWPVGTKCVIPVLLYPSGATPTIAQHIIIAQFARNKMMLLTYAGSDKNAERRRRYAACANFQYPLQPGIGARDPNKITCDEYPYATTIEGGSNSSTWPAPFWEQRIQGNILKAFYGGNNNQLRRLDPGDSFATVVIP